MAKKKKAQSTLNTSESSEDIAEKIQREAERIYAEALKKGNSFF